MTKKPATLAVPAVSEQIIPVRISFNPLAVDKAKTDAITQLNELQGATIDNDADLQEFTVLLRETVAERKLIEGMRDEVLSPIKSALKTATATVEALFRVSLEAKQASEKKLRELVGAYQQAKATEQRKQIAEAAAAAQARDPAALTQALVAAQGAAPGKLGGVSVREVWVAAVKAPDLVPFEWRAPDEKRIAAHAKNTPIDQDPTPIPGVLFIREARTTVR
jgi:hypothetical protein